MARKRLPIESLIMLRNALDALGARSPKRRKLVEDTADFFGVSPSTIRRALREYHQPQSVNRSDYNQPRAIARAEMKLYCELIAALKVRTTNKKGRHLSTKDCIDLIEEYGIKTPQGLVQAPRGVLKRTTVERYLQRWGLGFKVLNVEPAAVRFQAVYSNDCWQFDFSPSDLKKLKGKKNIHPSGGEPTLMLASVVDDRSGVCYQEYHYVHGEDVVTALRFLFNAMAPKKETRFPFQGIPKILYLDNGPVGKSKLFKQVMTRLNVEVRSHMPKGSDGRRTTARAKGKVERSFRTVKDSLETLYHFHQPETIEEANLWLQHYLQSYNAMPHRSEDHTRIEDWLAHIPASGFREMCSWERFCSFARDPEQRKAGADACVNVNGVRYQLAHHMAGEEVTLLWGLLDSELYVEYNKEKEGPFYPTKGPIPLNSYRKPKKSDLERRADRIEELAQQISIPRAALVGGKELTQVLLDASNVSSLDPPASTPFEENGSIEQKQFKNKIDAKLFIARSLGIPLARLAPEQMDEVNRMLEETLDKKKIMLQVRTNFSHLLKIIQGANDYVR